MKLKVMSEQEFDRRYQNMREWPLETMYIFYKDLMEEVIDELEKRSSGCNCSTDDD